MLQPDGTYIRKQSSWSSWSSSSSSSSRGGSAGGGGGVQAGGESITLSGQSSQGGSQAVGQDSLNTVLGAAGGPGDYHGTISKAELERAAGGAVFSAGGETANQVETTRYQGGQQQHQQQQQEDNDVVETNGGRWVWSEVNNKWEWEAAGGTRGKTQMETGSGSTDSGWTQLENGTWARKTSSWSSQSSSSQSGVRYGSGARGGVGTGAVLSGEEYGDHGTNSTGWVTMPDGTMRKQSSSWASWSGSGAQPSNGLEEIQRQLQNRVHSNLDLPDNVEPGFEREYRRRQRRGVSRPRRSLAQFQAELDSCGANRCTIIKCTIGPLEKDESVVFEVRSRLFTETQVKVKT